MRVSGTQSEFGENVPNPDGKGPGYFSRIRVENSGEPRKLRIELPCLEGEDNVEIALSDLHVRWGVLQPTNPGHTIPSTPALPLKERGRERTVRAGSLAGSKNCSMAHFQTSLPWPTMAVQPRPVAARMISTSVWMAAQVQPTGTAASSHQLGMSTIVPVVVPRLTLSHASSKP
jgi:hypothetical protein